MIDPICDTEKFDRLAKLLNEAIVATEAGIAKPSIRQEMLSKLKSGLEICSNQSYPKGQLKVGKKSHNGEVNKKNIVNGKRRKAVQDQDGILIDSINESPSTPAITTPFAPLYSKQSEDTKSVKNGGTKSSRIAIGDLVSLPAEAFDGNVRGSFSDDHNSKKFFGNFFLSAASKATCSPSTSSTMMLAIVCFLTSKVRSLNLAGDTSSSSNH